METKRKVYKYNTSFPLARLLLSIAAIVLTCYFHKLRLDVGILLFIYTGYVVLLAVNGEFRKKMSTGSRYVPAVFDLLFVTALVMVTGGSASILWTLYLVPVIYQSFTRGGGSGTVVALVGILFYCASIYYIEKSLKNMPADFIIAVLLVNAATYFMVNRSKKATLKLAKTDALTGTFNFSYFQDCIEWAIEQFQITGRAVSLLFIDVDDFKAINDTYGHQRGDEVLKIIGQAVTSAVRKNDMVFRYGGDEFAVILQTDAQDMTLVVAERIRESVRRLADGMTTFRKVSVSIGIAVLDKDCASKKLFLEAADRALYQSKKQGKNRVTLYSRPLKIGRAR